MMQAEQVKLQKDTDISIYFRFMLRDIDAASTTGKSGYKVDIFNGTGDADYRPDDRVSLFGHELADATHLSFPRFFYHHETKRWGPCYPTDYLDLQQVPFVDLVADVPGSKRDKKIKLLSRALSVAFVLDFDRSVEQVKMNAKGGFDLRRHYQALSLGIDKHIAAVPDAKFPCVNPRPENQQGGKLVD